MDKIDKIYTLVLQILSEKVWVARKNHPQILSQKVFGALGIDTWILTIVMGGYMWHYVTIVLGGHIPTNMGGYFIMITHLEPQLHPEVGIYPSPGIYR